MIYSVALKAALKCSFEEGNCHFLENPERRRLQKLGRDWQCS